MIKKAVVIAAAVASVAAAAGVIVVALSYALFAFARESLTPAASAAVVALAFAVILGLVGLILLLKSHVVRPKHEPTLVEKATEFVREKPLIALVGVLGASFLAVRNPALVMTLVAGMMAPKTGNKR